MDAVCQRVPANPGHKDFRIGQLLGSGTGHWRRVKNGLPQRYRLFFQYRSDIPKAIIYCWLNDQNTFRKEDSKSDVYVVFAQMISSGKLPNSYADLKRIARDLPEVG